MNANLEKKLVVSFICGDQSGPHFHDIFIPSIFFHKYHILESKSLFYIDFSELQRADVVIFQRQYAPESFIVLKNLKQLGKACIFLCDDNVWELPEGNPAKSTYRQADVLHRYQYIMRAAHAVITSTPYLASLCKPFNPNVHILRNLVDPAIADFKSPGRDNQDEIRIGWTGTPHHHDDILIVEDALAEIAKSNSNVKFVFMGYHPPNMNEKFPVGSFEYYNFVPVDSWYPCFASLDIDIGVVPLVEHPFNLSKTCRKFQEFGILSIPCVASDVGLYKEIPNDVISIVSNNKKASWIEKISFLIKNEEERKKIGNAAHDYVIANHDINKYIYERGQVFYDVYAQVSGTDRKVIWEMPKENKMLDS